MALTSQQQTDYYASQGNVANPLSPTAWLAQQTPQANTLVAPPPSATIDASRMGATPLVFPQKQEASMPAFPQENPQNQIQQVEAGIAQTQSTPIKGEAEQAAGMDRLKTLYEKFFGKPEAQQVAEQAQGIQQKSQAVTDIQSQINQLQNEAMQQTIALEGQGRGITQTILNRQSAGIERERTIKALQLNSFLYAAQGNLATAQDMADRAVKAEFEPIEMEIAHTKEWIEMNKDKLSREDKKKADALNIQLDERTRLLNDQKATKTAIQNIGIEAAKNGADSMTLRNIQNAKTPEEAITASGDSLGAEFKMKQAQQEFENRLTTQKFKENKRQFGIETALKAQKADVPGKETTGDVSMSRAQTQDSINTIDTLQTHSGLNNAVGAGFKWFARMGTPFTGAKADFIAEVEKLTSGLSLDSLIQAKSRGATFGALSDREMGILSSSATKIGSWRRMADDGVTVVGYKASEKDFKKELEKINNFAKLDYIIKGGSPEDVGATQMGDGTIWVTNGDGTFTQLR